MSEAAGQRRAGATWFACSLRAGQTDAERVIWSELRGRRLNGHKFVRQLPIGPYVADFVCRHRRLLVELDGSQHADPGRNEARTCFLRSAGYAVLRFWNEEVMRERADVLETILAALVGRLSPSPGLRFAPPTLSPRGEGDAGRKACGPPATPTQPSKRLPPPRPDEERSARACPEPGEGDASSKRARA